MTTTQIAVEKPRQETKEKLQRKQRELQAAIEHVKDVFSKELATALALQRVTAPRILEIGTGLQDDLAGTQNAVRFTAPSTGKEIEFVHSLAKWKRYMLGKYGYPLGTGIITDMIAIRKDEDISEIHSIYVDQWDWERVISKEDRTLPFLRGIVRKIYRSLKETEKEISALYGIPKRLSEDITFLHTEDLEAKYPELSPKEREHMAAKEHGAIFLIGIGHPLASGKPHDVRAADYDDWSTETSPGKRGLDGDIIVWDDIRKTSLELSSMGIRVDSESLKKQLEHMDLEHYAEQKFHKAVLDEELPLTIGGGIGQSRVCMFMLGKAHIGEVQVSVWPDDMSSEVILE